MSGRLGAMAILKRPPAEVDSGAKGSRLTEQQAKLVEGLALGLDIDEAGQLAGYSFRQASHRAAHLPHVQQALRERVQRDMTLTAGLARLKLTELLTTTSSERLRYEVAGRILDKTGIGVGEDAGQGGGGITLQLVIGTDAAAALALVRPVSSQVIEHEAVAPTDYARSQHPQRPRKAAPPPPKAKGKAKPAKGRGQKRPRKPAARGSRTIFSSPKTDDGGATDV